MSDLLVTEFTFRGDDYVCRELDYDTMMGIIEAESDTPLSKRLIAEAVTRNGEPLDSAGIGKMGFSTTSKIIKVVNEINGIGEEAQGKN